MLVKYCNADCQKNHWPKHKKDCKLRVAELRDEALFKDPPAKEDCPICFLPMPTRLIACISLPDATLSSVPIFDLTIANAGIARINWNTIFHVAGRAFVQGACAHSTSLETMTSVPFVNLTEAAKHVKSILKK
jgi:hypothetical protein